MHTRNGDITFGTEFKLDVGTLRLDQQVACQRYRQQFLDANTSSVAMLKAKNALMNFGDALNRSAFALAA